MHESKQGFCHLIRQITRAFREQCNRPTAIFAVTLTTVVHQEGHQIRKSIKVYSRDDRPAAAQTFYKFRVFKLFEMKRNAPGLRSG